MPVQAEKSDPTALKRCLESIDWSFSTRSRHHDTEDIHPYPAKFITDIPHGFLTSLPVPMGTAVLDPFCGSGTTLAEAQRFGIPSIGIDVNPIACLLSRVKTAPLPLSLDAAAVRVLQAARLNRDPESWDIPNIDHWFKPEIKRSVAALANAIDSHPLAEPKDALRLALSSIIVRVSNQESDTRYAAIEKNVTGAAVFSLFLSACGKISRALKARNWTLANARVIEADTLSIDPMEIRTPVGLVITSPPYPNAYEYWLYHKYRMWWLGYDPLAVKAQEIGARAHFFKRNHHSEVDFKEQMRATFKLIDGVLVEDGLACFVIGRSRIHGKIIDNASILTEVANEFHMCPIFQLERTISARRKSFNLMHANIKTETMLVFSRS